jgi:hypothetical protein|tara:strand:+ start:673 stop:1146 length:474 start_codon:yes stop_codon:yes gene_type:complete
MLAELAACNAAFQVIKATVKNGSELTRCASQIGAFINGEDALRKNLNKKKNSFWAKAGGAADGSDLEEFFALEEIKEKRKEIEQLMIFAGRPGLHGDWVNFQVEARRRRKAAVEAERKRKAELIENLLKGTVWFLGAVTVIGGIGVTLFILRQKGII